MKLDSSKKILLVALATFLGWTLAPQAYSQTVNGAGSTSTNFQKIGMGARAVGMGESFIAVADDATAIFWNPAGLALAKGTQFNLTHGEWLVGVTHEFFAFSQNIDRDGAFGGSVGYLGTGSFPGALETPGGDYGGIGNDISASDYIGSVGYAQRLGNWIPGDLFKKMYVGLKATVVGQSVVNVGSSGLAFDMGALYEVTPKTMFIGAVFQNIGTTIEDYSQPMRIQVGGSYRFRNLLMKKDRNIVSLSSDIHIDTGMKFNIGDEYRMALGREAVALRLGYRTGGDLGALAGLTAGVGVSHRFDDFEAGLDYAFVPYGVLGLTHRVSLNVAIGGNLAVPQAFVNNYPAFILGQQNMRATFSTKGEEPIDHWKATILDSTGMLVKTEEGKGNPPSNYSWDGKNQAGTLVPQGNYSIHLEVTDDEDMTGKARPRSVFAKWVPKKVPYQYTFQVPGDLLFDSGKDELLQKGYDAIQKAVGAIQKRYPDSLIIVAGHTDNVAINKNSKFKDNQELSLARAKSVMDYLVRNGMKAQRLSVMGYGEKKPIADNKTPEGRSKNRRVELVISGVQEATAVDLIADGNVLLGQKRYRDALDRFLKAIESDSRNSTAYHLAGNCYLILGGKPQATQCFRKAYELNPKDLPAKQWLEENAPASLPQKPAPATAPSTSAPAPAPQPEAAPAPAAPAPAAAAPAASGMPMPVEAN
jgi:outer membrane protein OmpA-like peptidoglycan-associated protein